MLIVRSKALWLILAASVIFSILGGKMILERWLPLATVKDPRPTLEVSKEEGATLKDSDPRNQILTQKFNESPMVKLSEKPGDIFRLFLLPRFDGPLVIRLEKTETGCTAYIKKIDSYDGYHDRWGHLEQNERDVDRDVCNNFVEHVGTIGFWVLPQAIDEEVSIDGATWLLEGCSSGICNYVERSSPDVELSEVFKQMLAMANTQSQYEEYLALP
jgi:hypothetical protein